MKKRFLALIAGAILATVVSVAQDQNVRSVEGQVLDKGHQPVSGASVQLKDVKTLQVRSFITKEDGLYHFAGLSTNNEYELAASTPDGKSSSSKRLSVYDGRKTAQVNLEVK